MNHLNVTHSIPFLANIFSNFSSLLHVSLYLHVQKGATFALKFDSISFNQNIAVKKKLFADIFYNV